MRLQLFLEKQTKFDLSYRGYGENARAIAAWLYHLVALSDEEYSKKTHNVGLSVRGTIKVVKPFCFSGIGETKKGCVLNVSSPDHKYIFNLKEGIKKGREGKNTPLLYTPADKNFYVLAGYQKEELPEPKYFRESENYSIKCHTLSPVVVRSNGEEESYLSTKTDTPEAITSSLLTNLSDKFAALHGTSLVDPYLLVKFGDHRILEYTMTDSKGRPNTIIGHIGDVTLTGNIDLIMVALENGLGAKNALGAGYLTAYKHACDKRKRIQNIQTI